MSQRGLIRSLLLAGILILGSLFIFTACGDDDEEEEGGATAGATEEADGEIDISDVPELEDGEMFIGSDFTYPPIESYEEGTENPVGLDVDLWNAIAELLGVEIRTQQVADFAGIVGDLKAKRYDVVWSAISITPEREAEIDFIPYFGPVGTGVLTQKGNPEGIKTVADLCGRPVAAQVGTFQVEQMDALNADTCKDDPIDIQTFPDNPAAVQELSLGRVDAELADDPVAAYSALQSDGDLEVAVTGIEAAAYGIGVRKDSPELKAALEEALQKIIDDGTYERILGDWGQEAFAVQ